MKRVLFVMGTRPEVIKLAPVIKEMERSGSLQAAVCVTGQHREMLDQVLKVFSIEPHWDLDLMRHGQDLFGLTAAIITGMKEVLLEANADLVVVQGDTTTAFMAGLAANYKRLPVAHVEAGLRTGDRLNPFPEETNRTLLGVLSQLHFAPTETARDNLLREGIEADAIWVTGNTVIDALIWARDRVAEGDTDGAVKEAVDAIPGPVRRALNRGRKVILVTGHRRESFGQDFESICLALKLLAERNDNIEIVYPVHLNPNVRAPVYRLLEGIERIHLIDPPSYLGFVWLLMRSHIVLTDSGGVQEEAPTLGKPVLVMRRVTERPEGVEAGCAKVVGVQTDTIISECEILLRDPAAYARMSKAANPYGDGTAARQIVAAIEERYCADG